MDRIVSSGKVKGGGVSSLLNHLVLGQAVLASSCCPWWNILQWSVVPVNSHWNLVILAAVYIPLQANAKLALKDLHAVNNSLETTYQGLVHHSWGLRSGRPQECAVKILSAFLLPNKKPHNFNHFKEDGTWIPRLETMDELGGPVEVQVSSIQVKCSRAVYEIYLQPSQSHQECQAWIPNHNGVSRQWHGYPDTITGYKVKVGSINGNNGSNPDELNAFYSSFEQMVSVGMLRQPVPEADVRSALGIHGQKLIWLSLWLCRVFGCVLKTRVDQ